jgi:hypothetical protein
MRNCIHVIVGGAKQSTLTLPRYGLLRSARNDD